MNFAVIKTGGKQYKVSEGDNIKIEKIKGDFKAGDKIVFDQVLLTDDGKETTVGAPLVKGAKVEATLIEEGRNKKLTVLRYKAKSNRLKINGHKQPNMKIQIDSIK
jgi:large subunit ribosomal protein L21